MTRHDEERDDATERRQRRESLMERRLRVARGEQVDEPQQYDDDDDDDDEYVRPRGIAIPVPMGSGGCTQTLLYTLLAGITIVLVAMLVGRQMVDNLTSRITSGVPDQVRQVIATPTPTLRDRGGTIVQIQALNRLETLRFSIERVVEAGTETGDWRDALLGEKLLLIASGDVIVGVDLSRLRSGDITISPDGKSISLRLPPSEIFSAALNNERTRVYNRDTRLGTRLLGSQDPTLETQARQGAESEILKAACEADAMRKAADEAQRSVEQFLRLLDFESVTVVAQPGQCVAPSAQKP
jgi:hypothetical protein